MKRKILTLVTIIFVIISVLSINETTYAFFKTSDNATNKFNIGNIEINIDEKKDENFSEDFKDIEDWNGEKIDKYVRIQNKSIGDAFIRVSINLRWVYDDEFNTPFAGNTNFITVNFSNNDLWHKDNKSNYYYYKEIIDTNEYTEPIIDSIESSIENLDVVERSKYLDKKLIVQMRAEAVQASFGRYKTVWTNLDEDTINLLDSLENK